MSDNLEAQRLHSEMMSLREEILERSLTNIQKNALRRAEAESPEALAVAKDLMRLVNQAEKSQHRADANASTINRLETELAKLKQNPPTAAAAGSSGTIWAKVYTDDGYQISLTLPAATVADALKHMAEIRAAGLLPAPVEPPSMEETETITTVVRREHFDKSANTIVPVIDCYPDWRGQYGQFRFTSIYLDTPADVAQFEAHAGVKLDSLPLYESQAAIMRNTARPHRCEVKTKAFVVCKKYSGDKEIDGKVQRVFKFSHFVSAEGYATAAKPAPIPAAQLVVPASMISPDVQAALTAAAAKPAAPAVGTPHGASAKPVTPPAGGNPFEIPATQNAIIHAIRANGFSAANFSFLFANIIPGKTLTAVRDAHPDITPDEFLKRLPGVAALYQTRLDHETHADDDGYQPDPNDDPAPATGTRGQSSKPAAPARSTGRPAAAGPSTDDVRNKLGSPTGSSTRKLHPLHGEMVEIDRIEGCRDRRGFAWEQNKWIAHGTSVTPSGLTAAFSLTIWPEDARKLTDAGHAIEWPSGANEYAPFILHPNPVVIAEFRGSSGLCIRTVEPVSAPARKHA